MAQDHVLSLLCLTALQVGAPKVLPLGSLGSGELGAPCAFVLSEQQPT